MSWTDRLRGNTLDWLLEDSDPGVRYLALRDLSEAAPDDTELAQARSLAHKEGPIASILSEMDAQGYWVKPGPGYNPKYRSAVWSLTLLAQLGARIAEDERIGLACDYLMQHALNPRGQFSTNGAPSGTVDCLQGNLCWALLELGVPPERLAQAFDWMARSQTGAGIAPASERDAPLRYYAYKCGPNFACGAHHQLPCAWGAAKVTLALGRLPEGYRTPEIHRAIQMTVDFFFSVELTSALWCAEKGKKPSPDWWKFGFPVFYITDLLQVAEGLAGLGLGRDDRLAPLIELIWSKQDADGRWPLEYDYLGKTWVDFGAKHNPNKWVTLRALRVLKAAGQS
jgi:hypothetical protein